MGWLNHAIQKREGSKIGKDECPFTRVLGSLLKGFRPGASLWTESRDAEVGWFRVVAAYLVACVLHSIRSVGLPAFRRRQTDTVGS